MSRSIPEWIGRTDDEPVPPRVRLRVLRRFNDCCANCGRFLIGQRWTCDHTKALINGGENRERNLQPLGDKCCNPAKNAADVAEKSRSYHKQRANAGIRTRQFRPLPGTKASGIRLPMRGGVIDRRTGDTFRGWR